MFGSKLTCQPGDKQGSVWLCVGTTEILCFKMDYLHNLSVKSLKIIGAAVNDYFLIDVCVDYYVVCLYYVELFTDYEAASV